MSTILASDSLAVTSEKLVLQRVLYWMKHELLVAMAPGDSPTSHKADATGGKSNNCVAYKEMMLCISSDVLENSDVHVACCARGGGMLLV